MSKEANIIEIYSNRPAESNKAAQFDTEILSIIGSINSRAQLLRSKFNMKG